MKIRKKRQALPSGVLPELCEDDIFNAMKDIDGYFDITPADFLAIYNKAQEYAMQKHEHKKQENPPGVGISEILWSWIGAFLGIALVALLHYRFFAPRDLVMIIGSFGATAVLVYGAVKSPLAQPRNVIGGHIISAFTGVLTLMLIPDPLWLSASIAVATSIALMHATGTLHPPGGATALIAVTGGEQIKALGFLYALFPAAAGAVLLVLVAVIVNNISGKRKYPEYWF